MPLDEFNWLPDLPDYRDYRFKASLPTPIPEVVDMRDAGLITQLPFQPAVDFVMEYTNLRAEVKVLAAPALGGSIREQLKFVTRGYQVKYERVAQTPVSLKKALARGFPVVFGFSAYENYGGTNYLGMPGLRQRLVGGVVAALVGYDTPHRTFLVRDRNYFSMPAAYVSHTDLARDFWIIRGIDE